MNVDSSNKMSMSFSILQEICESRSDPGSSTMNATHHACKSGNRIA